MVSGHCTTLREHVISMRTSYFEIDFASQTKLTKFFLIHCFDVIDEQQVTQRAMILTLFLYWFSFHTEYKINPDHQIRMFIKLSVTNFSAFASHKEPSIEFSRLIFWLITIYLASLSMTIYLNGTRTLTILTHLALPPLCYYFIRSAFETSLLFFAFQWWNWPKWD